MNVRSERPDFSSLPPGEAIVSHIATTPFAALPETTRDMTARALLDGTGVIRAASGMSDDVKPFLDLAAQQPTGPARVLGTNLRVTAEQAAFANGAMAHALDYEDAFDAAPLHPNASMIPAALALAQELGSDGKSLLTALAIGCDLACRIGLSLRQPMEANGWYPPPIIGAWAATAACARLLALTPDQTRHALSLMLCQASMPGAIKHTRDTNIRAIREAFPAQAAITATRLAKGGVIGFDAPLEGRDGFFDLFANGKYAADVLLDGLGRSFHGDRLSFKPWPSCRGTHAYIELALQLIHRAGFGAEDIAAIHADIDETSRMLIEPLTRKQAPTVAIDAKFSIPFTIALAAARGRVTLDDFDAASLADRDILAFSALVRPAENDAPGWPMGAGGRLVVTLRNGQRIEGEVATLPGSPERPLSRAQLIDKYVDCTARARVPLDEAAARAHAGRILDIASADDINSVFA